MWVHGGEGAWGAGYSPNTLILMGNYGNVSTPIAYVRRPKGIPDDAWTTIKSGFENTLRSFPALAIEAAPLMSGLSTSSTTSNSKEN